MIWEIFSLGRLQKTHKLRFTVSKGCSGENVKNVPKQQQKNKKIVPKQYFVSVLEGSKDQSIQSQMGPSEEIRCVTCLVSHFRSQKWGRVCPRKICGEAFCLMERIPETHAGDPYGY